MRVDGHCPLGPEDALFAHDLRARAFGFLVADRLGQGEELVVFQGVGEVAGEKLEEQHPERVGIAGGGDGEAPDLLGAGVAQGQGHLARGGGLAESFVERSGHQAFGDTEVENPRLSDRVDQDVARFEIAVHHEALVGERDRRADLGEEAQPVSDREPPVVAPGVDGLAVDILHGEVGNAIAGGTTVEDSRDVRVIEVGQDLAFSVEPLQELRVVGVFLAPGLEQVGPDQLQGDLLLEVVAPAGEEDGAHASLVDPFQELVGADPIAGRRDRHRERQVRRWLGAFAGNLLLEQVVGLGAVFEQGLDFTPQLSVVSAGLREIWLAVVLRAA